MEDERSDEVIAAIKEKIIHKLEYQNDVDDEELKTMIAEELKEYSASEYLSIKQKMIVGKKVFHSMRKLDILQDYLEDSSVTEIMINGPDAIFVEQKGRLYKSGEHFESEESLRNVIQQIVAKCNRVVNEASPIVDARLSDGSRVNVVLNPIAINGPILTIRRFPQTPYLMEDLVGIESLTEEVAHFLKNLVIAGYNIIVSGGTGSGKTTFLNALSAYIPCDERIITIEDSAELQIQGIDNLVRLETRNANVEGCRAISIRDLIKTSLRMRPSRIIVGEVRGAEAMDMICAAMNCGHDGSMSTVHANNASDTIGRLETMIMMAADLPVNAIRQQICSGVDIIVHLGRLRDKTRKVLEISEIIKASDYGAEMNVLYRFVENELSSKDSVKGSLQKIGELKNVAKLQNAGLI
ncbi:MAG: CpaF family protein [Lachnospiraceae bacterium]|nr:CpaF family protein [Candidatus Colinaster equi]